VTYRTLIGSLAGLSAPARGAEGLKLAAFSAANFVGVAECYFAAYPHRDEIKDLAAAKAMVAATLKGDYGHILPGASPTALLNGQVVGSLQVVQRSTWDSDLDCPLVIELFVHPEYRRRGIASTLLAHSAQRLRLGSFEQLAVRVGPSASVEALQLGSRIGFTDLAGGGTPA